MNGCTTRSKPEVDGYAAKGIVFDWKERKKAHQDPPNGGAVHGAEIKCTGTDLVSAAFAKTLNPDLRL